MSEEQKDVMTPVNKENVSFLLKRLDDTGIKWFGGEKPSVYKYMGGILGTLHIEDDYLSYGIEPRFYTNCKLVTWNEFVRIARERCGDKNEQ